MFKSKYFSDKETSCRCGKCGEGITEEMLIMLHLIRKEVNRPLIINSGRRCLDHNTAIGGATKSRHLTGEAVDIRVHNSAEAYEIASIAMRLGCKGIGIAKTFVHVDIREGDGGKGVLWLY